MSRDIRIGFIISKLVDEVNAQVKENGDFIVIYDEEIEELNEAIESLGMECRLTKGDEEDVQQD